MPSDQDLAANTFVEKNFLLMPPRVKDGGVYIIIK